MQEALNAPGIAHFLSQADVVGRGVLVLLGLMSVTSWYFIVIKSVRSFSRRVRSNAFLRFFADAPDLESVREQIAAHGIQDPFSRLVGEGFAAVDQLKRRGTARLIDTGSDNDFLTRALRRSIERTTTQLESGLTVLASVGAAAPFVGLFGTVWGIYNALLAIGVSGQGTLDRVAGPVGEALVMTAVGLAVAIPAVLGYNALVRSNRVVLAELESFAHDIFGYMTTGRPGGRVATGGI